MDLGAVYRESRHRLTDLAATLTPHQLEATVPACPAWTVKDLYGHLAGLATDIARGDVIGAGSDEATDRQVKARRNRSLQDVLDEWADSANTVEEFLSANPKIGAPAIDAWTHEQDIRGALGLPPIREGTGLALTQKAAAAIKGRLRAAGVPALRIIAGDDDRVLGDGEPQATLRVDRYEWARVVMGRRSLDQIRHLDWDGDPEPYLPHLANFTPPATPLSE